MKTLKKILILSFCLFILTTTLGFCYFTFEYNFILWLKISQCCFFVFIISTIFYSIIDYVRNP